ncbi:hypothetical protein PanWU01x14_100000 [Parasponia andersonii]|uniref:Uncharacterized protein n=1 Tax=Parasponia andersonii TaxID=3476 RepID=A0A2P5D3G8_PARAD|nr:hypothetical protein PanWU01x14_100000 [Parasponia andersonii]
MHVIELGCGAAAHVSASLVSKPRTDGGQITRGENLWRQDLFNLLWDASTGGTDEEMVLSVIFKNIT